MRIDGEWYACDDDVVRPIVRGEILNASDNWEPTLFLVDTGADRTVISAAVLDVLGFDTSGSRERLGGVGGTVDSVEVTTRIRLRRENGGIATFRGQFAGITRFESLDMSILGRDIMNAFSILVDRAGNVVTLIRPPHQYVIQKA